MQKWKELKRPLKVGERIRFRYGDYVQIIHTFKGYVVSRRNSCLPQLSTVKQFWYDIARLRNEA